MNQQVKNMYEEIHMPRETEQRIRKAMTESQNKRQISVWKRAAAMAAMLVLVLCLSPTVRAAVESWVVKYVFPDSGMTLYEQRNEDDELVSIMGVDTESEGFAQYRDGRLWFTGNGECLDITEEMQEDAPFYYTYVDDYGLTHYMAVGYSGTLENFGIYEFIREVTEDQSAAEGWVGGSGRNYLDPVTETRYPWVDLVWQHWNIPWSMPE